MKDFLLDLIQEAGSIAKGYFERGVAHTTKSNLGDLLTEADLEVSRFLVDKIHAQYPDHQIHSEEMKDDVNPGAEYEWVIDPIDGTRNFAMGIPFWCHLIAILKNGELYMSAVYSPIANELFFAEVGQGAFLNGKQIHVNSVEKLDYCFAVVSRNPSDDMGDFSSFMHRLLHTTTAWIHQFGSMLSLCHLAMGGIDFVAMNTGKDHDYLAPTLICREAGAIAVDSTGAPWTRYRRDYVLANPKLLPQVMEIFQAKNE